MTANITTWRLIICLAAGLTALAEPDYEAYRLDIREGNVATAELAIRRELRSRELQDTERVTLTADLAMVRRLRGKPADGLQELEALPGALRDDPLAELERGRCLLAAGEAEKALSHLLPLPGLANKAVSIPASLALARLHFERKMYQDCIDWCRQAITLGRGESEMGLLPLVKEARELLAEAMDAFALQKLGDDYFHYRKARIAQAQRKYDEATEFYRLIKTNPVLKDAAACYTAECLAAMGEAVKANRAFRHFVTSAEYGLYRGEAQVEWARFRLLHKPGETSLEETYEILTQAVSWFETVHTQKPAIPIGDATLIIKYFPAPEDYTRPGDLGGLIRHYAGPETILNRLTARWYLPMYQVHAYLLQGFVAFQLEDLAAASAAFDKAVALNRASGQAFLKNDTLRSQLHAGLQDGTFLVPKPVWERVGFHHGPRLQLACFYAVAGEYGTARGLLEETVRAAKEGRRLRDHEQSVVNFGLAYCYFNEGKAERALQQLEPFQHDLDREDLAPAAWLLSAHLKAADPQGFDEAKVLYTQAAKKADSAEAKAHAMFCLAIAACNRGENELALKASRFIVRHFDETTIAPAAQTLISRLDVGSGIVREGLPAADPLGVESLAGRVVPVQNHLILPGSTQLHADFEDLRANDLMLYQITASPQSACIIIRGFDVTLTPFEPQIVPARGRQMTFLRAPILFRKMLWAAPEEEPDVYRVGEEGQLIFWQDRLAELLKARNPTGAERLLKAHLGNPDVDTGYHPGLHADLARVYRESGNPRKALSHLEGLDFTMRARPVVRLQLALAKLELGQTEAAAEDLERTLQAGDAEVRATAARHAAQLAYERQDYEAATRFARQAVHHGATPSPASRAQVELARDILEQSERATTIAAYGEPYWYYRQGRRAQAREAWEAAVEAYDQVDDPILGQAARCYKALCLHRLGETREAIDAYEALTQAFPEGLYTGEAYLEWARITYLDATGKSDIGVSRELLERASKWQQTLRDRSYDTGPISAIMRDQSISNQLARPGHRSWPGPEVVLNPATASWYGDYLGIQIHLMLGFVNSELGDPDEGRSAISTACSLIARNRINPNPVLDRLNRGLTEGAFLVPASSWRRLSRRAERSLRLACFLYASGQEWAAEPIFMSVLEHHGDRLSKHDAAVVQLGLAACEARKHNGRTMQHHLAAFSDEYELTKVAPLADALYQLGP